MKMNKNVMLIVAAFVFGVILTQYLSSRNSDNPLMALDDVSTKTTTIPVDTRPAFDSAKPKVAKKNSDTISKEKVELKINKELPETLPQDEQQPTSGLQVTVPRYVKFILDDYSIGKLERNINELSVKVKMLREERGWRVQYVAQPNTMASLGLFNNDLILHEMIESARANRDTVQLIERMENIFEALR